MVYIEMSFGERCQLFQHLKFLCQVRIFSSNYIILIFWGIHVWYMVIRVIVKRTGGVKMIKKVISVVIAICLMFISTVGSSIQPIYAASSARINPDDMLTVLNDITVAGQSWENIGFDSEDIANIMQMQRKDDSILCVVEHGHS